MKVMCRTGNVKKVAAMAILMIFIHIYLPAFVDQKNENIKHNGDIDEFRVNVFQNDISLSKSQKEYILNETNKTKKFDEDLIRKCFDLVHRHNAPSVETKDRRTSLNTVFGKIKHVKGTQKILTYDPQCTSTQRQEYIEQQESHKLNQTMVISAPETLCGDNMFLLIFILSTDTNTVRRNIIRSTWDSLAQTSKSIHIDDVAFGRIGYIFVVGSRNGITLQEHLQQESNLHGDIVQGDFVEHYDNLGYKTLLGLHWVASHCPSAKFIMKTDDDIFVNIPALITLLKFEVGPNSLSLIGHCMHHSPVYRKQDHKPARRDKWVLTCEEFPFEMYPPYASGHGYVMTTALALEVLEIAKRVKPYTKNEDSYVGGVLRNVIGNKTELICPTGFSLPSRPVPKVDLEISFTLAVDYRGFSCYEHYSEEILSKYNISLH